MRSVRFLKFAACVLLCVLLLAALVGCQNNPAVRGDDSAAKAAYPAIKVGTLQTDDLLPLWVAESEGLLIDAQLDVEIMVFKSPKEQMAALQAGEIDAIMTDMVVPALLTATGTPMRAVTVMQGAPAGIVVAPDSGISDLKGLANVPVGTSSATIVEYNIDTALAAAGVPADEIKIDEGLPDLATRLQMLIAGNVKAAGLPWTLVALAEQQGATVLFDREQAKDYPATVLCFTQYFLDGNPASGNASTPETAAAAIATLLEQWDKAVDEINADPDSYRALLVEKANLPEPLKETYPVPTYPKTQLPEQVQWDAVLAWMDGKGYLPNPVTYDDLVFRGVK